MSTPIAEYGMALYTLASEEKAESEILGNIRAILPVLSENPDFIRLLSVPSVSKAERMALIDRVFGGDKIHPYLLSFFKLLIKRDRAGIIPDTLKEFERLWYLHSGIAVAEVRTAVPLTGEQKSRLLTALEKKTGKDVELRTVIDKNIIAGVSVTVDGMLISDTLRGRLDGIKQKLSEKTL